MGGASVQHPQRSGGPAAERILRDGQHHLRRGGAGPAPVLGAAALPAEGHGAHLRQPAGDAPPGGGLRRGLHHPLPGGAAGRHPGGPRPDLHHLHTL